MKETKKYYWIKLRTDFFEQAEIDFLMSQPNGCQYIVLYQMLCLNTANTSGELVSRIGDVIVPFDARKIVRDTKYFDIDTVTVALELFKRLGLIYEAEEDGSILRISNIAGMIGSESAGKEAEKKRKYRAMLKEKEDRERDKIEDNGGDKKGTICPTEIENRDKENRDRDIEIEIEYRDTEREVKEREQNHFCQLVAGWYNETCVSFPRLTALSEARKKAIKARLRTYSLDDFKTVFQKAEASSFLKGKNDRNWSASFDWLLKDSNFAKVLDGNYDDRTGVRSSAPSNRISQQLSETYSMLNEWAGETKEE